MNFYSQIELVPPDDDGSPVTISIPGSKSITNRALILAAISKGQTTLHGALWSEDTQIMVEALRKLGFSIEVEKDFYEPCNRIITITGLGGEIPNKGSQSDPLEIYVGNAGTAARFLVAFLCTGQGVYRVSGVDRMHKRPQKSLFKSLKELGYKIESNGNFLPATIYGGGRKKGDVSVSIDESSQFASALLLVAKVGDWNVSIEKEDGDNMPYVEMTKKMISGFPIMGGDYKIEPDSSSASYFWAAAHILGIPINITNWPSTTWQIDTSFPNYLPIPSELSREIHLGDSILTAIAIAPLSENPCTFNDLGRLRVQECERVIAMRTELSKLGANIKETGDSLFVEPSLESLNGAEIDTYDDHRIAMSLSLIGIKVRGVRINDPGCVKKTFPNFFSKWTAPKPNGLGFSIIDTKTKNLIPSKDLIVG